VGVNMGKTLSVANIQTSLTREQKEAVGLLSIGTFLEFFDLMLYVHMAVLLNDLFFPKTDQFTSSLLSAFVFCTTFVFRPIGALIFGWIGDNYGRKTSVVITTFLMAVSCIIMAITPTYAEIGITASLIVTSCRIVQGMSSMGEKMGAEIYIFEITRPPVRYPAVGSIALFSVIGTMFALIISSIVTSKGFSWRYAFGIGAVIAVIGFVARSTLKESVEFSDARKRISLEENSKFKLEINYQLNKEVNYKKNALFLFFVQCAYPVSLYITYIYSANILKNSFGYSSADVITRNLGIVFAELLSNLIVIYLSYSICTLKILRVCLYITSLAAIFFTIVSKDLTPDKLLVFQLLITMFSVSTFPATPVFLKYIPILKRFTIASLSYAISRAAMYIITSFGIVYFVDKFNYIGILIVMIPTLIFYYFGLRHFEKLEKVH
jgi:MFS family permease